MCPVFNTFKSNLIDFSRYNRLTHYKMHKKNEYLISSNKLDALIYSLSAGNSFKIDDVFPLYEVIREKKLDNVLYLAVGLFNLTYKKNKHYSFPIMLYRVDLSRDENNALYLSSVDNDIYLNPYFRIFIYEHFDIALDEKFIIDKNINSNDIIDRIVATFKKSDHINDAEVEIKNDYATVSFFTTRSGFSYADLIFNNTDIERSEIIKAFLNRDEAKSNERCKYKFNDGMLEYVSPISFASTSELETMFAILRGQSLLVKSPKCRNSTSYKINIISELLSENKSVLYLTNNKNESYKAYNLFKDAKLEDNIFAFAPYGDRIKYTNLRREMKKGLLKSYLVKMLNFSKSKEYISTDHKRESFDYIREHLNSMNDVTQKRQISDLKFSKDDMFNELSVLFEEYYLCTVSKIHNNVVNNRKRVISKLRKEDIEYIEKLVSDEKLFERTSFRILLRKYIQLFKKYFMISIMTVDEVNRYIPSNMKYDVLVIDNASSHSLLNTIPALYRARQVIAFGDDTTYTEQNALSSLISEQNFTQQYFLLPSAFQGLSEILPTYILKDTYSSSEITDVLNKTVYNRSLNVPPKRFNTNDKAITFEIIKNINSKAKRQDALYNKALDYIKTAVKKINDSIALVTFDNEDKEKADSYLFKHLRDDNAFNAFYINHADREPYYVETADFIGYLERDEIVVFASIEGKLSYNGGEKLISTILNSARKRVHFILALDFNKDELSPGMNMLNSVLKASKNQCYSSLDSDAMSDDFKDIKAYLKDRGYILYENYGDNPITSFDLAITNAEESHINVGINFDEHASLTERSLYETEYMQKYILKQNGWDYGTVKISDFKNNALVSYALMSDIIQRAESDYTKSKESTNIIKSNSIFKPYAYAPIINNATIERQIAFMIAIESPINKDWLFSRIYKTYYSDVKVKKAKKYFKSIITKVMNTNTSFCKKYNYLYDMSKPINLRVNSSAYNTRPKAYISDDELISGIRELEGTKYKTTLNKRMKRKLILHDLTSSLLITPSEMKYIKKINKLIRKTITL